MNGHCSKDIVASIVYTYNHGKYFCINVSLFREYTCMFDGIAEHKGRKTELSNTIFFFYEIAYFSYCFILIYFYLTI